MKVEEFKRKLDNREFWGENSKEMWDAAYSWADQSNEEDSLIKWSWDCGLKLDYDGGILRISSRFYPPHKTSSDYNKYHGTISIIFGDNYDALHEHKIESKTLDELKELAESYVSEILDKIQESVKVLFAK